eukprot:m.306325 g.306325  ORF g.306325 m.306325 type:complete len:519 (+) comp41153_c0_seq1:101-1657(+)
MSFIRLSKVRHVFPKKEKRENCYDGFQVTRNAHDGDFCAVNTKYLAIVPEAVGGGAFYVHPLDKRGRHTNSPKVCGHKGTIFDVKWNPFDEDVIASASEDCLVKLWQIPEGGLTENLTESVEDLEAHQRKVTHLSWHPTAEFLLASSATDHMTYLWDIRQGEYISGYEHPDNILSMSWSHHGDQLATTCKDKKIRVLDPRNFEESVLDFGGHDGAKNSHVVFLGDSDRLFSTGFSRTSERQYAIWDARKVSKPLTMEMIDTSSGVLHPYYDHDTKIMFLVGKGDGNIRYYEVVKESPYCYFIDAYSSSDAQRGIGVCPKRALNTKECEIFRIYKLHAKPFCEIIGFYVPRKSDLFQDDIYPPCVSGLPTISVEDFMAGKKSKLATVSLKPKREKDKREKGKSRKDEREKAELKPVRPKLKSKMRQEEEEEEEEEEPDTTVKAMKVEKSKPKPKEEPAPPKEEEIVEERDSLGSGPKTLKEFREGYYGLLEENEELKSELALMEKKIKRLERQISDLDQ